MNYLIIEGKTDQKYNATSKAREDINNTLLLNGFKELNVKTSYKRFKYKFLKIFQIPYMIKNRLIWRKTFKNKSNLNIVIQYPVLDSVYGFDKVLKSISKNNNVILLIHDLDSLRGNKKNIIRREDEKNLRAVNHIICHNESMKNEIMKMGIDEKNIIPLNIFDYLYSNINFKKRTKSNEVIIAGNLSPQKVKYLEYLDKVEKIDFNLYGVGFIDTGANNIHYKGKYTPEELLNNLDGSFGLIWDGESIDCCSGNMGNYLRYNNPHKLSLYMAAGIPVIAWKKSAIAKFIIDNNVGIVVDSLSNIDKEINKITEKQYQDMKKNSEKISFKIKNGSYTIEAINNVIE